MIFIFPPWWPQTGHLIVTNATVRDNLNVILYVDDIMLSSTMCSLSSGCNDDIERVSILFNSEWKKFALNKLSLNVQKK